MTYPNLDWSGRKAVLVADAEQEALRLYAMDLLWILAQKNYAGNLPQPSKLVKREITPEGPQTAEEIKNHVKDMLSKVR